MSLPFIVDSLDQIKEEHRTLYVEENGKFRLDIEGYEDPKGLKTAQRELRGLIPYVNKSLTSGQKQTDLAHLK